MREARVRPDHDARVVDELDLRQAVRVGDDLVAHEDGALKLDQALAAGAGGVDRRVDADGVAARLERGGRAGKAPSWRRRSRRRRELRNVPWSWSCPPAAGRTAGRTCRGGARVDEAVSRACRGAEESGFAARPATKPRRPEGARYSAGTIASCRLAWRGAVGPSIRAHCGRSNRNLPKPVHCTRRRGAPGRRCRTA